MSENSRCGELKKNFAETYDREARDYDERRFGCACRRMVDRLQGEIALGFLSGCEKIIEAGCGTGRFTLKLAQAGHEVSAFDVSGQMLSEAREKVEGGGAGDRVSFALGDIEHINAADNAFDGAFTNAVIRHFPDPQKSISELARVVRPGGIVVVDYLNRSLFNLADAARNLLGLGKPAPRPGFFKNYYSSLGEMREHMRRAGLAVAETRSVLKFPAHLLLCRCKLAVLARPVEFLEREINWGAVTMVKGVKR